MIASGRERDVLTRLAQGECIGSELQAALPVWSARKQWLADHLRLRGRVTLDDGAVQALLREGKSLLPIGVPPSTASSAAATWSPASTARAANARAA